MVRTSGPAPVGTGNGAETGFCLEKYLAPTLNLSIHSQVSKFNLESTSSGVHMHVSMYDPHPKKLYLKIYLGNRNS